jgi:Family of unknown function (DUF6510)
LADPGDLRGFAPEAAKILRDKDKDIDRKPLGWLAVAESTCGGCGKMRPIAEQMFYLHGMGAILRCAGCDTALIRITHIRGYYRLDLSGMSCLRIAATIH